MLAQLLSDLQETHVAIGEALRSCAKSPVEGVVYLRELRAVGAAQGAAVERLIAERGLPDVSR
jgi:hypothetical protein